MRVLARKQAPEEKHKPLHHPNHHPKTASAVFYHTPPDQQTPFCACDGGCPMCQVYANPPVTPSNGNVIQRQPGTTANKCSVKSFKMGFGKWNEGWSLSSGFTRRLPVKFTLELDKGVSKTDCRIGQDKMGEVWRGTPWNPGSRTGYFPNWTSDSPREWHYWWDGTQWNTGQGRWWWTANGATFYDEPGFNEAKSWDFPLYWGGVGKKGYFKFRTYVADAGTKTRVRELNWGMLIDYSSPANGVNYFYF